MINSSIFGRIFAPTILACLILMASKPTQANNTVKAVAILATLSGCCYLCTKSISKLLLSAVNDKYKKHYLILDDHGYQVLKKEIMHMHEISFFSSLGPYRNYPLLKYKEDLDWYITMLWIFRPFNILSETSTSMSTAIKALSEIREKIVYDETFIQELRRFEKQQKHKVADAR